MPTAAAAHGGFGGPLSWLLTSVIGVGVLVLIAGLGLAIRTRRAARPGPEESTTLDFLDGDAEPHQAPGGPRRAAGP